MSLRIVVCVKYVPDATGDRHFAEDLTTDREAVDGLLSELDEYAVEQALQIADAADDAEITVLTVGPQDAQGRAAQGAVHGRRQGACTSWTTRCTAPTSSAPRWCWRRPSSTPVTTWWSAAWPPPTAPWACCRRCWPSASACRR